MRTACIFVFLSGSKIERMERANHVGRFLARYASIHTKLQKRTFLVRSRSMIRYSLRRICFLSLQLAHLRAFFGALAIQSPFAVCGEYTLSKKKQPRPEVAAEYRTYVHFDSSSQISHEGSTQPLYQTPLTGSSRLVATSQKSTRIKPVHATKLKPANTV